MTFHKKVTVCKKKKNSKEEETTGQIFASAYKDTQMYTFGSSGFTV